jgi:transposase
MTIITVGIDLAKNVFSVHGVDENAKVALRRTLRRDHVLELIATLHPCVIAMETCSGAHHWARQFAAFSRCP